MSQYSLIIPINFPKNRRIQKMLDSLEAQTNPDWEAVLLVKSQDEQDHIEGLIEGLPRFRTHRIPDGELVAKSINGLLPTLGTWIGQLGQYDQLTPAALTTMTPALTGEVLIGYSDEHALFDDGQVTLRTDKGVVDSIRLRHHDYLKDLCLIQKAWLEQLGGFDLLATDNANHDLFLRTLSLRGEAAFAYVPERLFLRWRPFTLDVPLPTFDLRAVQRHLATLGLSAQTSRRSGSVVIDYRPSSPPAVTALVQVDDDVIAGSASIRALQLFPRYPGLRVIVAYRGASDATADIYRILAKSFSFEYQKIAPSWSWGAAASLLVNSVQTPYVLLLRGVPIGNRWLHRLMEHMQRGVVAAGGKPIYSTRLSQPGIIGWKYEDWDWNTRGKLNVLGVPHQVSALSPNCLVLDLAAYRTAGGFRSDLFPTLFGHDFCLRLAGMKVLVPQATVSVQQTVTDVTEAGNFASQWDGWSDPYQHHLPISAT